MEVPHAWKGRRFAVVVSLAGLLGGCPGEEAGETRGAAIRDGNPGAETAAAVQCQCEPVPVQQPGDCAADGSAVHAEDEVDGAAGAGSEDPGAVGATAGMGAAGGGAAPDLTAITDLIAGGGSSSAVRLDPNPVLCPGDYKCEDLMGFPVCKKEALPPSCTTNADCAKAGLPNVPCVDLSSAVGFPIVACLQLCNAPN